MSLRRVAMGAAAAAVVTGAVIVQSRSFVTHSEAPAVKKHRVVVIGGGTGGCSVAAQLIMRTNEVSVSIIEPRQTHYYQPMWTMIGGHMGFKVLDSAKPMGDVLPKGAAWVQDSVKAFQPEKNMIVLESGKQVEYDSLIVSTGIKNDYEKIKGLKEALEDKFIPVGTIYDYRFVEKTDKVMGEVKSGNVIFTQPNCPIKCGGAPQKVMWLWESEWRNRKIRDGINISFLNNLPGMFQVPKYCKVLNDMADEKKIERMHKHDLVEVDGKKKIATFKNLDTGILINKPFDAMHVTPYMSPPECVSKGPLANETGYITVNKETLQHTKYSNVFALGDSAGIPTSKTAASISSQAPVLVSNLLHAMNKKELTAKYDGYASCPILVGDNKLVLAEFLFAPELIVAETFPWDQSKPSTLLFYMKKDFFPFCYWNSFVSGTWYGKNTLFRPSSSN